eukprot:8512972-Alexandrium_andersonii.AAC.1
MHSPRLGTPPPLQAARSATSRTLRSQATLRPRHPARRDPTLLRAAGQCTCRSALGHSTPAADSAYSAIA